MYLINYGVDINKKDKNGNTPLHLAVIKNSYKMVQKLLQKGAISNIKNQENKTENKIIANDKGYLLFFANLNAVISIIVPTIAPINITFNT